MTDFTRWFLRYFDDSAVICSADIYKGNNGKYDFVDSGMYYVTSEMIETALDYAFSHNSIENVVDYIKGCNSGKIEEDFFSSLWDELCDSLMEKFGISYHDFEIDREMDDIESITGHFYDEFEAAYMDICDDVNRLMR